jgi:hypothetical protein
MGAPDIANCIESNTKMLDSPKTILRMATAHTRARDGLVEQLLELR